jgi:hypothetical protein
MDSITTKPTEAIGSVNKQIEQLEKEINFLNNSTEFTSLKEVVGDTLLLWRIPKCKEERDKYIKEAFKPFKSKSTIGRVINIYKALYSLTISFEHISFQYSIKADTCRTVVIRDYNIDNRRQQIKFLEAKLKKIQGGLDAKSKSNSKSAE